MNVLICRLTLASIAFLLLSGCANTQYMAYQAPNTALFALLEKYGISDESSIDCQSSSRENLNCESFAADLRSLNSQFSGHQNIAFFSALVEHQMGRLEQAQFVLDLLLAKTPTPHISVVLLRAQIALDEGNISLAREVLYAGLRAHPDHPEIYSHLAATFYLEGRYERADESLITADRLGLAPWKTNFLLGLLHKEKLQVPAACQYFSTSLQLKPGHKMSLAHLIDLSRHDECAVDSIF